VLTETSFETIRVRQEGPLCWLFLDRPSKSNAFNPQVFEEIDHVLADLATDRSIKVLIFQGSGKGFSSGHELGRERGSDEVSSVLGRMNRPFETFRRIWELPKVVIASVHGYCYGAATQLCECCDLVVVSSDVQIGLPRLPMGAGLTPPLLALTVGVRRAKQIAFDIGSTLDGETAVNWGWANFCVPSDQLTAEVTALALRISRSPLNVLLGQKASLNRVTALQGFWTAATIGIEMDAMHHYAQTGAPTSRAIKEVGVRGALEMFSQGLLSGD